jgi:hypothetical protein
MPPRTQNPHRFTQHAARVVTEFKHMVHNYDVYAVVLQWQGIQRRDQASLFPRTGLGCGFGNNDLMADWTGLQKIIGPSTAQNE